jgi:hypothetical protein
MQPVTYCRRASRMSRGEREWRVEERGLATRGALGRDRCVAWGEIANVRLCRAPKMHRPWRHVFEITPKHGRKIVIDNVHMIAPGEFEDRSESYCAFVRAATERLAIANPRAKARVGDTPLHYFVMLILALLGFGLLAFGLTVFPTALDRLPNASMIKFAIVVAMVPLFAWWMIAAMPRGVKLCDIPDKALPHGEHHHEHHEHAA